MAVKTRSLVAAVRDAEEVTILFARRAPFGDAAKLQAQSFPYVLQPIVHGEAEADELPWETLLATAHEQQGRAWFTWLVRHTRIIAQLEPTSDPNMTYFYIMVKPEEVALLKHGPAIEELLEIPVHAVNDLDVAHHQQDAAGVRRDSRKVFVNHLEALHGIVAKLNLRAS